MLLLIDNYDSFTFNLMQYLGELEADVHVARNDALTLADIEAMQPTQIVLSPGPCTPAEAGICVDVVRHFGPRLPILGVCLGHQCIGVAFGGRIVAAQRLVHGKTSPVQHDSRTIFRGLPTPFDAMRYHSLALDGATLPESIEVSAWTEDGEIMAVRHRRLAIEGIQFHPESILTPHGKQILAAFLAPSNN
jgi:anthranilate synthase component II